MSDTIHRTRRRKKRATCWIWAGGALHAVSAWHVVSHVIVTLVR